MCTFPRSIVLHCLSRNVPVPVHTCIIEACRKNLKFQFPISIWMLENVSWAPGNTSRSGSNAHKNRRKSQRPFIINWPDICMKWNPIVVWRRLTGKANEHGRYHGGVGCFANIPRYEPLHNITVVLCLCLRIHHTKYRTTAKTYVWQTSWSSP